MSIVYLFSLNLHFSFLAKIYYKSSNILGNWLDGLEKCGTLLERNYAGLLNGQWETKNSHTYLSGRWIPYNFSVIGLWGWRKNWSVFYPVFLQLNWQTWALHSKSFCTHEKSPTSLPRKTQEFKGQDWPASDDAKGKLDRISNSGNDSGVQATSGFHHL